MMPICTHRRGGHSHLSAAVYLGEGTHPSPRVALLPSTPSFAIQRPCVRTPGGPCVRSKRPNNPTLPLPSQEAMGAFSVPAPCPLSPLSWCLPLCSHPPLSPPLTPLAGGNGRLLSPGSLPSASPNNSAAATHPFIGFLAEGGTAGLLLNLPPEVEWEGRDW